MLTFTASLFAVMMLIALYRFLSIHLKEVAIIQMVADRDEDHVEFTVGGCRLRKPVEVKFSAPAFYGDEQIAKRVYAQLKLFNRSVTKLRWQGVNYSF